MHELRTVLFIDFDNIAISLENMERRDRTSYGLADIFGFEAIHWTEGLEDALPQWNEGQARRLLVQRCYLNPQSFWQQRQRFSDAGFQCIDCPPMTKGGKTATDMYMAMHLLDCLNHPIGYDEFVICSGDADFSPIVRRLREYGKRVVLVLSGPGSQAYLNSADYVISASEFAGILRESVKPPEPDKHTMPPNVKIPDPQFEKIRQLAEKIVADSPEPIRMAKFLHILNSQIPKPLNELNYFGHGTAANLLRQIESERLRLVIRGTFNFVYNSLKHENPLESETDVLQVDESDTADTGTVAPPAIEPPQASRLSPLILDVCKVTSAPRLDSDELCAIFSAIQVFQKENAIGKYGLTNLSLGVRDETARQLGYTIGRNPINWMLMALNYAGLDLLRTKASSTREIGEAYLKNILLLCAKKAFDLTPAAQEEVRQWILQKT